MQNTQRRPVAYITPAATAMPSVLPDAQNDLRALWLVLRRRALLLAAITGSVFVLAVALAFLLPKSYQAESIIMLDARKTRVTNVDSVVSSLTPDVAAVRTEVAIITSRAVVDRVITALKLDEDPSFTARGLFSRAPQTPAIARAAAAEELLDNLSVTNDGRSFSITLGYRDADPAKAASIANAFADAYLLDQLDAKYDATQRASAWLSGRLEQLQGDVQRAEKAVEDYKTQNNLLGVGEETLTQQQLLAINSQLVAARAEQSQAEAKLRSTEALIDGKGNLEAAATVLSSPLIQSLKTQEAEVGRKTAELAGRYGDKHPSIINARAELRDIRAKISQEVQKIVQGMRNEVDIQRAKVESLTAEMANAEGRTGAGDQAMVMLRQLQREAAASRSLYEGFLARSKQIAEQQDLQVADARIVARADAPLKAAFPRLPLFAALGLALGVMQAFFVVMLLEYFDRGFRTMTDLEKLTGVASLGLVPQLSKNVSPAEYVLEKPLSSYAEALRTIRAAVHYSNIDNPPKVVMVTSSVPGEGKTTFCLSLGRVLAKAGHKVLLIDADLRRPSVQGNLQLKSNAAAPDLVQVLTGAMSVTAATQTDASGLSIIAAHSKAPNPQDLLSSQHMERLVQQLRATYDFILVDTPPVLAVADAAILARMADTALYLVKWGMTSREMVQEGMKQLQTFGVRVAGTVLTQVDLAKQARYGYGDYGSYYGHYQQYYSN